jgi:hypothetical protein
MGVASRNGAAGATVEAGEILTGLTRFTGLEEGRGKQNYGINGIGDGSQGGLKRTEEGKGEVVKTVSCSFREP